jgi:hypothetical protein
MKILSERHGFASDHSSTSYEFLAVDKPLGKKERSDVSKLSNRANPTSRRANFIYHVDGYDIPGGWEKYGDKDDENPPPKPQSQTRGEGIIKNFIGMLGYIE